MLECYAEERPRVRKFTTGFLKLFFLALPVTFVPRYEAVKSFLVDLPLFDLYLLLTHFSALPRHETGTQQKQYARHSG